MRIAVYKRVSAHHKVQAQAIEQQLELLRAYCQNQHWSWQEVAIFHDDGESSASLKRPGLDRPRDQVQ
jgi:site-specific DNA recombinase